MHPLFLRAARPFAAAALVAAEVLVLTALPLGSALDVMAVHIARLGIVAPVAFGALYVAWSLLMLPTVAMSAMAGALFGLVGGGAVALVAASLSALVAFGVARLAGRRRVAQWLRAHRHFRAIDRAVAAESVRVVVLLRLTPVIPFGAQNYLLGLTALPLRPYVLGTVAGLVVPAFMYAGVGSMGAALVGGEASAWTWGPLLVGIVAGALVVALVARRARALLDDESDEASPAHLPTIRAAAGWWAGGALILGAGGVVHLHPPNFGPPPVAPAEAWAVEGAAAPVDWATWDALLHDHVDDEGRVDYAALVDAPHRLDAVLADLATVELEGLGRDERLATAINAYNAFTWKLIVDHWPVASIHDIPSDARWQGRTFVLGGQPVTLDALEHAWIRPHVVEPRVHFALNCASVGCPPLRREAYVGERLEAQLQDQAARVHARGSRWYRFDRGGTTVALTRLYDWYGADFLAAEPSAGTTTAAALTFAARHDPDLAHALAAGHTPRVAWLPYDWSLNVQERP